MNSHKNEILETFFLVKPYRKIDIPTNIVDDYPSPLPSPSPIGEGGEFNFIDSYFSAIL